MLLVGPSHRRAVPGLAAGDAEALIEEARRRARRRRRNLAVVLVAAALVAGLIAITGSGSPTTDRTGGPASPPAPGRLANSSTVVPKQPVSLAVGPNGELYVADTGREQILRRLPNGRFVVVAGTGIAGYTGDGGRAVQAEVDAPGSVAIAPNGALFFVQRGRAKASSGLTNSVVREVATNGRITTVIGQDPNCAVVPSSSISLPAKSAELSGASLTIGSDGLLDVSTTACPNILHLGSFLQLTSSGELVQTSADSIPKTSGYCGGGIAGPGFIAFGCSSGAGRGPRLMVVRCNGAIESYPNTTLQPNDMSASNGTVVAIHNGAVVRVGANGLETIATQRQLAKLASGAHIGDGGIAVDRHGTIYIDQDFLVARRDCADVIVKIDPKGHMRALWHSALSRSCY